MRDRQSPPASATAAAPSGSNEAPTSTAGEFWELRLYVAGRSPRAETALSNLKRACEAHLNGQYAIEVVDLLLNPRRAGADQIVALPTLVRRLPEPIKKMIGDLSDLDRVLVGLDLRDREAPR